MDPTDLKEPYILPNHELNMHRERVELLIRTARYGLETLYKKVSGQKYVILLTDAKGVTVDYIGDPSLDDELRAAGLYLGAEWSEARAGTTGVGSCIYTGEALTVHQLDHFDATHTPLTCSAAPIYASDGTLTAVLDISALCSPQQKGSQSLALQLVKDYARRIELASLVGAFNDNWILRLSRSPEFLHVEPDCALAISQSGLVAGMTHAAQRLLADCIDMDWRHTNDMIGQPIDRFLDLDLNELPLLTHALPGAKNVVGTRHAVTLFAHAMAPQKNVPSPGIARTSVKQLTKLHGGDSRMAELATKASKLADAPINILLTGETGTGKEHLARAIHQARYKVGGDFVAVNCAAIPETLIESELFGYVDGAFTGAKSKGKRGLIEQADGGTLFLDEIGDMPLVLQARLLRVLAEGEVLPVGALTPRFVSLRVVAASHRDLVAQVKAGQFREDLYYRINGATLHLPALRNRKDLDWLVGRLLSSETDSLDKAATIAADALRVLRAYSWPGNIRELSNTLKFALAFSSNGVINRNHLPDHFQNAGHFVGNEKGLAAPAAPKPAASDAELLGNILEKNQWNVSAVSRQLGVDRTTVHRRMRKHGLVPPNRR
ncbi:MAG: sigma-54-dependent Fis family transcriptional regulator [Pseudomonadota bacterium]